MSDRSGFKLNAGDRVTVIGMPVVVNQRHVVLARQVSSMNGVLIVRDEVGKVFTLVANIVGNQASQLGHSL